MAESPKFVTKAATTTTITVAIRERLARRALRTIKTL
jgi:hypothetical protein